jgi:hypothetical protein
MTGNVNRGRQLRRMAALPRLLLWLFAIFALVEAPFRIVVPAAMADDRVWQRKPAHAMTQQAQLPVLPPAQAGVSAKFCDPLPIDGGDPVAAAHGCVPLLTLGLRADGLRPRPSVAPARRFAFFAARAPPHFS